MTELYESGKTLQEVGDIHNLSRERVRQLFKSIDYKPRPQTVSELHREALCKAGKARRSVLPKQELERMYVTGKNDDEKYIGAF